MNYSLFERLNKEIETLESVQGDEAKISAYLKLLDYERVAQTTVGGVVFQGIRRADFCYDAFVVGPLSNADLSPDALKHWTSLKIKRMRYATEQERMERLKARRQSSATTTAGKPIPPASRVISEDYRGEETATFPWLIAAGACALGALVGITLFSLLGHPCIPFR